MDQHGSLDHLLLEAAEEPGLWLPAEPKLELLALEGLTVVFYGRSVWVHRIRLTAEAVPAAIEAVRDALRARGLTGVTWWCGERTTPTDLPELLAAAGLEPDDPAQMTTQTISRPPLGFLDVGQADVSVRRVETLEDHLLALEIDWESFNVPEPERVERRAQAADAYPQLRASGQQITYLASLNDRPVGFARAVLTPSAVLLLGGATLPEARGHGVYTALVHARWEDAVARGIPRIVVSAGPMSAPILERLGFAPIGLVRLLRDSIA